MSLHTYAVEGGIGKHVAFTALTESLAQKAGEPIQMLSAYPEVFANNPHVGLSLDMNTTSFHDERVVNSAEIFYREPYKSNFVKGKEHILESYSNLYGIEYNPNQIKPSLYLDYQEKHVNQWLMQNGIQNDADLFAVQFTGSQSPVGFNPQMGYQGANMEKNYPHYLAQGVINYLKQKYPNCVILDCTLPNEPGYWNTLKCPIPWQQLPSLLKKCKGWIGIDSCIMHMSVATRTPGVCLWGNTRWTQFGYTCHYNMTAMTQDRYNIYEEIDPQDPRNIMVDPQAVVEVFDKHIIQGIDSLPFDNILPVK